MSLHKPCLLLLFLVALGGAAWSDERAAQPAFKGMELYSWRVGQTWYYALVEGTNRNKTWPEIEARKIDEATLREKMKHLAVGELVSWGAGCEGAPAGLFAYPPAEVKKSLVTLAEDLRLQIFVAK